MLAHFCTTVLPYKELGPVRVHCLPSKHNSSIPYLNSPHMASPSSLLQPSVANYFDDDYFDDDENDNDDIILDSPVIPDSLGFPGAHSNAVRPATPDQLQLPPRFPEDIPLGNEEQLQTLGGVITTFLDHLECAIHTILYERSIYPRNLFMSTRKYNCAVKMCRVTKVNEYVRSVIELIGDQLMGGRGKVVSIIILSPQNHPLERFNFDVSSFPEVEKSKVQALLLHEIDRNDELDLPGTSLIDLYEQFRAVMTSLSVCSGKLGRLPEDCTWTVAIETKEGPPVDYKNNWLVSDRQPSDTHESIAAASAGIRTTPLRTVESGAFSMEVWIEESGIKSKLPV
ncbi:DNA-binding protein [Geopyxis carbonaria]|nr:DNA-binding protein [Geopyxis carbonaria]